MSDIEAIVKLTSNTGLGPPGPMIGFHGFLRPNLNFDPILQAAFDGVLAKIKTALPSLVASNTSLPTSLDPFSFALVDLTDDARTPGFGRSRPAYAGFNDTKSVPCASLIKLLPLYAAHQLRSDARALASVTSPTSIADLASLLRKNHRRMRAADDTFPLVEEMFELDAQGIVQFRFGGTRWDSIPRFITDLELKTLDTEEHVAPPTQAIRDVAIAGKLGESTPLPTKLATLRAQFRQVEFREQLRLMAGWSNNTSATLVTQAIGFTYLWTLAQRSGLFRSKGWLSMMSTERKELKDPGGFFLGQDYSGNIWTDRPRSPPIYKRQSSQAACGRSVAQLMTSLAYELIDEDAHISMREMLRKNESFTAPLNLRGESSPIGAGMGLVPPPGNWRSSQASWNYGVIPDELSTERDALVNGDLAVSKIGLLDLRKNGDGLVAVSNALLVRTTRGSTHKKITAVLVGLGVSKDIPPELLTIVLTLFGGGIATALDARHPS